MLTHCQEGKTQAMVLFFPGVDFHTNLPPQGQISQCLKKKEKRATSHPYRPRCQMLISMTAQLEED